ncbi:hypothetical protein [Cupriavidus taiwanensis]|uniref:hypothetical protein n=1 Tax=Cupriavidus taiwanensis TaxID=164546 RepID=UPI000E1A0AC7|nr:hypothetical protein [Cupriavidus taiwanensis]SPA44629.1 conserved hypothetical protein [Cupriavidus taiwanensis]
MHKTDYDAFAGMLDAIYSLHGKTLPAEAKAMFFRAMSGFSLDVVRSAMDAHVRDSQRGQFPPKPADLMAQIEGAAVNDGRPGPDEAWAIALRGLDEAETVVTTAEIMEAFGVSRAVLDGGDEVGARMAFKDAYARIVQEARRAKKPAGWTVSLGWDVEKRGEPVRKAVEAGLLPAPTAAALLPAPMPSEGLDCSPEGLARLKEEMAKLTLKNAMEDEARELAREEARQAEIARKQEIANAVAQYQANPKAA